MTSGQPNVTIQHSAVVAAHPSRQSDRMRKKWKEKKSTAGERAVRGKRKNSLCALSAERAWLLHRILHTSTALHTQNGRVLAVSLSIQSVGEWPLPLSSTQSEQIAHRQLLPAPLAPRLAPLSLHFFLAFSARHTHTSYTTLLLLWGAPVQYRALCLTWYCLRTLSAQLDRSHQMK